ncbi:carboxymuconolactone decarboxylase family protein [Massilia scottii]|uniref:carboxymuconolactone decarboxylase family protein n=1 Tax=Massilia scottii TaxID=3057166 RepID=UPI002796A99A|nr:carboxymuconolactone decarboxylase family protein [Massilia sp. CCM 9029]MDQ1832676.1 carboxymuconolactone decarboxylase family protein [Massilia sp. CCM 9029]
MATTRIVPLEAPYEDAVAETFKRFLPPGMEPLKLFRTQAHNPRVLQRTFAGNLLDQGSIDLRTRELIILRTCARCGSEYEWGVHVALFAERAALSAADVAATLGSDPEQSALPAQEVWLLKTVDELHDSSTISDGLWDELARHYSSAQVLEIIALTGNYHAISFMTNAARVELETFAPRFSR